MSTYYFLSGAALGARNITVYKTKSQITGTYILVERDKLNIYKQVSVG